LKGVLAMCRKEKNIIDYIRDSIAEDATPEEYQALLDDMIPAKVRGRLVYESFKKNVDALNL
jgi:hypothetical protein